MPIAAYAKYGLRNRNTGERQVESLRVVTVRGLACKWLYHFGDAAQRESTERTFVGIHKNKEHARNTLALPFDPGLDSVDGRSIDSIIAFDAAWIDDDSIRVAQSYERDAKTSSSFATLSRVERSIDQALAFWMKDSRPEGGQGNSYRPEKVLVNPAAWDGEKAHLIAALDLQTKELA